MNVRDVMKSFQIQDTLNTNVWEEDKSLNPKVRKILLKVAKKIISMYRKKTYEFFSERENQIIEWLSKGATYKEIADQLYVTPSTVNFHIQNIYLKLDVNSKSEALKKIRNMDAA